MKVYFESMVDSIEDMIKTFTDIHGYEPTHIEMSRVEYNTLIEQLNTKYLVKNRLLKDDQSLTTTIRGLIIKLKN